MKTVRTFLKQNILVLLLILFTIPSFVSLIRPGFFTMHDDLQAFRIHQMDKCIQDFQIPCRWVPDMGFEYGYPQFNYYPPSVYYFGELIHLIGFQFIDATKILIILGFLTAALAMYLFLGSFLGKWPAFVGAIFYTYAPYKAVDVYVRGAISEFWALTFFPLILWAIYKLIKTEKAIYVGWLGLFGGLALITHNLMPLTFLPVALFWTLIFLIFEKKWRVIPKLIFGVLLGIGLASFFSLPLIFEKSYVHVESIISGYFDYRMHFVSLEQLFISNFWGYGSSVWGPYDGMSLSTGQIHALMGGVALILALSNFRKNKKLAIITSGLFLIELGILFLVHQKSSFIWSSLPFLAWLQFPWRFLGSSIFLLSVMAGIAIYISMDFKILGIVNSAYLMGIVLIISLFTLHFSFFQPRIWLDLTDKQKFSDKSWQNQLTVSIFDYLPIYAKLPPTKQAPPKPEILEGQADFSYYKKGSNFQTGQVIVSKEALIRLPLFDFPGMKVWVDGKKVSHWHDDCRGEEFCLGLITFKMPEGSHRMKVQLTDTPVRTIGNLITFLSILILIYIFKKGSVKEENL